MHKRYVVVQDYIDSHGFRVSKGDSITPGDTATAEVLVEAYRQMILGNLREQGAGEESQFIQQGQSNE